MKKSSTSTSRCKAKLKSSKGNQKNSANKALKKTILSTPNSKGHWDVVEFEEKRKDAKDKNSKKVFTISENVGKKSFPKTPGPKKGKKAKNEEKILSSEPQTSRKSAIKQVIDVKSEQIECDTLPPQKKKLKRAHDTLSPETVLGLEIEKALSPESLRKRRKLLEQHKNEEIEEVSVLKKHNGTDILILEENEDEDPLSFFNKLCYSDKLLVKDLLRIEDEREQRKKTPSISENEMYDYEKCRMLFSRLVKSINIKHAMDAVLKLDEISSKDKEQLFGKEKYMYLQFTLRSITRRSKIHYRVRLPHSIYPNNADICLITSDIKGKMNEPEEAIDFYSNLLRENGVTHSVEIVPLRQLKKEYTQYEQRRKFRSRFHIFLVEKKIIHMPIIRTMVKKSNKSITRIDLSNTDNLKDAFERALRYVSFRITGRGNTFIVKFGRIGMPWEKMLENVHYIYNYLKSPYCNLGGKSNYECIHIKTALSAAVPVFVNMDTSEHEVEPLPNLSSESTSIEGKITTLNDKTVAVYPSGQIKIRKSRKMDKNEVDETEMNKLNVKKKEKDEGSSNVETENFATDNEKKSFDTLDREYSVTEGANVNVENKGERGSDAQVDADIEESDTNKVKSKLEKGEASEEGTPNDQDVNEGSGSKTGKVKKKKKMRESNIAK